MCTYSFVTAVVNSYVSNNNKWLVINITICQLPNTHFLLHVTLFTYVCRPARYIQRPELNVFHVSRPHTLPLQYKLQAVFFILAWLPSLQTLTTRYMLSWESDP